jgi:S1-C subfamily serine protease
MWEPRASSLSASICVVALAIAVLIPGTTAAKVRGGDATTARSIESSVVKLYVYTSPPDPVSPWQKSATQVVHGSGVIIDGDRILTSAHLVEDYSSIEVKRAGKAKRFPAEVTYFGHQCDLALLSVPDERFFKGATALEIGNLPRIQSAIDVYGFPIGGDTVSVSSGIVSRIEVDTYMHSVEELLLVQIDASINSGNSGGPAINDGQVVGIAAQSLEDAENVGYVVPAPVITHFLEDVADGRHDGFPELRVEWQVLESDAHRASLGMKDGETGVLATRLDHGGSASRVVETGDVLLTIDGMEVANNGTVLWPGIGRLELSERVRSKHVGDTVKLGLLRDGRRFTKQATLRYTPNLVPGRRSHTLPSYLVFGGLVFRPLTINYLALFKNTPFDLANHALFQNVVTPERRQVVVISHVLPAPVNRGYQEMEDYIVETINGIVPRDMEHLAKIIDEASGPWLEIVTEERSFLTLSLDEARAAHRDILAGFGIDRDRSPELDQVGGAEVAEAR